MADILTLQNVKKQINKKPIIKGLSFSVREGEIFGFLGPNGAGKTTTIRMIVGLMGISEGDIFISGKSITKNFEEAVRNVGAIVENPEMYKFLTGYQNLKQFARMHSGISEEKIKEVVELVGLSKNIHQKVRTYSLGMRQRLGLAQCLLHDPKLLILDEPTNGLDPAGIKEMRDHLRKLTKEKGMSVIVSSHLLSEMEMMCDRIAIIQNGELIDIQQVTELVKDEETIYQFDASGLFTAEEWLVSEWNATINESGFTVNVKKEDVPKLIKRLVESDVAIYSVHHITKSLEDRFFEMTAK